MQIAVLGTLEVAHGPDRVGPPALGGKPKQVLEILVAARGRPVTKEQLIDQLWGERPPLHPMAALENHVWTLRSRLRTALPGSPEVVIALERAYRLDTRRCDLDLDRFDDLVREADRLGLPKGRPQLEEALALVGGDAFDDEPYAPWADRLRDSYRVLVQRVRLDAAEAALASGAGAAVVAHASDAIESDPLNERACRLLMRGLALQGERERAIRLFVTFRELLRLELDLEPLDETIAVFEHIRAGTRSNDSFVRPLRPAPDARLGRHPVPAAGRIKHPPTRAGTTPLVGRSAEVAELTRALESIRNTGYHLAMVEGLAHVGKTRVVRDVLATMPQVRVGWTRCNVSVPAQPHLPLFSALSAARSGEDESPASSATIEGLDLLCDNLHDLAPAVLVLDDVHHLDGDAVAGLAYLKHRCADVPVAVVAVGRTEDLRFGHPVRSLEPTSHLRIATLNPDVLTGSLGEDAVLRTGGYGAYVEAWLAGARHGPPTDADLLESILERCRASGSRAYRILLAASVLPEPISPETVSSATGITVRSVAEELDRLLARGLLRELAGGFAFSAGIVADSLAHEVSQSRRHIIATSQTDTGPPRR